MLLGLAPGCFGYTSGAKHLSYVADSLLIVGGGAAIAVDQTTKTAPCEGTGCPTYTSSIGGLLVAGVMLATAGLIGIVFTATRPETKSTSR